VLTSMLRRELTPFASPELRASLDRYETRMAAFSDLHRALTVGAVTELISVRSYIEHLCRTLSEALLEPLGIRCEVHADAGEAAGERCERLGLIIVELVMNAAKYAFQGRNDRLVRIELCERDDSWVCIVSDNGAGTAKASLGVGSKIIKQLVQSMGGDLVIVETHWHRGYC